MGQIRVLHLIAGLGAGGAEIMLQRLVSSMDRDGFHNAVVSMMNGGGIGDQLLAGGVGVSSLGMRAGIPNPAGLLKLRDAMRRFRPDVVQAWMYHANLLGALAMREAPGASLVWGLHHSNLSWKMNKLQTLAVVRLCGALSRRVPRAIVCCSESVRRVHAEAGYDPQKLKVIANGYDTGAFRPSEAAGAALRGELAIPSDAPVVSLIARFHPQKNHRCFLDAAAFVLRARPDAHFVLCGTGADTRNETLAGWIAERGLTEHVRALGPVGDVQRVMAGSTVVASSSSGEGMSNAIGEAMACGTVCVVTDVGDSAAVVGDTGFVAPPDNPEALGRGLLEALGLGTEERRALGAAARRRIDGNFGLSRTVREYQKLYEHIALSPMGTGRKAA